MTSNAEGQNAMLERDRNLQMNGGNMNTYEEHAKTCAYCAAVDAGETTEFANVRCHRGEELVKLQQVNADERFIKDLERKHMSDWTVEELERYSRLTGQTETREEKAARFVEESGKAIHSSDCATSIAPAEEPGLCDCDEGDDPPSPREARLADSEETLNDYLE